MTGIKRGSRLSFFILCYSGFLDWMSFGLVFPIFAALVYDQNLSFFNFAPDAPLGMWLGVLVASSPLAQFLFAPFVGALSDHIGRKPILWITSLIAALGYFISTFGVWKHDLFFLILGRIVTGIGAANNAAINSAISDISEVSSKAKNYALIGMANGIGFALGPLLGGKLAFYDFNMPFIFGGIITLIGFFLIFFFFKETHVKRHYELHGFIPRFFHSFKVTDYRKFNVLFLAFLIFCLGWAFFWQFIPVTWINIYRLNVAQIGNFYAIGSAFYVISSGLLIQPILKRFSGLTILFVSLASLGFFIAILYGSGLWLYWICIPIQQFLVAMIFPVGTALVSNMAGKEQQGEALGVFQSLQSCAFSVTPFLGGPLLDLSYNTPLSVSFVSMFVASLILLIGYRGKLFKHTRSMNLSE